MSRAERARGDERECRHMPGAPLDDRHRDDDEQRDEGGVAQRRADLARRVEHGRGDGHLAVGGRRGRIDRDDLEADVAKHARHRLGVDLGVGQRLHILVGAIADDKGDTAVGLGRQGGNVELVADEIAEFERDEALLHIIFDQLRQSFDI